MKLKEVYALFANREAFITCVNNGLRYLITQNPDFQYTTFPSSCFYNTGPPHNLKHCNGCIFGQVLQSLGWSDEKELVVESDIIGLFHGIIEVPPYWLRIQIEQDTGKKWRELLQNLPKEN